MLNAVSSGSWFTNVTPVRAGGSSSRSDGCRPPPPQPIMPSVADATKLNAEIAEDAENAERHERRADLATHVYIVFDGRPLTVCPAAFRVADRIQFRMRPCDRHHPGEG